VDNPILQWDPSRNQYWPNAMDLPTDLDVNADLFPVERTYDEWLYSQYARQGVYAPQFAGDKVDGFVSACQDCHMNRAIGYAADTAFNPVFRDCLTSGCLPEHTFVGGNTWIPQVLDDPNWRLNTSGESDYLDITESLAALMLRKAATVSVTLTTSDTLKLATVRIHNHTGHKLPTGYPEGRRMWINMRAYDADDVLVYESGAYDYGTGELFEDPDIKVYEVKQGITPELAALLNKQTGESFHFVLNNTTIKDNRIPPKGVFQTDYDKPGLRPVQAQYANGQYWDDTIYALPASTERVLVTLYYQTASSEYIDFLAFTGGIDGVALKNLWDASKSPPAVMAKAWYPNYVFYVPALLRND
jgi:hypothetical protein